MDPRLKKSLDRMFFPRSVAIAGVSSRMDNPGTLFLRSLRDMGFEGDLYPVNPRYEEILGLRCYPDINSLPAGIPTYLTPTAACWALRHYVDFHLSRPDI